MNLSDYQIFIDGQPIKIKRAEDFPDNWFWNCEPTQGGSYQNDKERKSIVYAKKGKQAGICSEERSMISPDYARNFICDFILGKVQKQEQLQFDF